MKRKFSFLISIALIATMLVLQACGGGSSTSSNESDSNNTSSSGEINKHSLKVSLNVPPTHNWTKTAEKFKEELEAQSDGQMTVELFPNSQLGETDEITKMMESGTVDLAFIPSAFLASKYKELNAWFLPFLFENEEAAIKMRETDVSKELLGLFESQGLIGMDWIFTGNHSILVKDGAMDNPDAFKGVKLREPGTDIISDLYKELGASAVAMPLPEIYTSLQTGVIDGLNASPDSIVNQRYYEVANDYTLLNQTAFNAVILLSEKTNSKFNDEESELLFNAMKTAIDWGNEQTISETENNLKEIQGLDNFNLHEVTNYEPFYEIRDKLYEKYSSEYPLIRDFIEEAQKQ